MSSELETSQPELHLEALEIFLVGNRDLERLEAPFDAHHLLRLQGGAGRIGRGRRVLCNAGS